MLIWVTVKVVPVVVALAAVETVIDVALGIAVIVVLIGIPVPLIVIPNVKALVEPVVTVVLPLVVSAIMVEDTPRLTHWLFELWQATQNVGLVEILYWLVPRLGVAGTPSTITLSVSPSWLKSMIVEKLEPAWHCAQLVYVLGLGCAKVTVCVVGEP